MKKLALALSILLVSYLYGVLTIYARIFPYNHLQAVKNFVTDWGSGLHDVAHLFFLGGGISGAESNINCNTCQGINHDACESNGYKWTLLTDSAKYAPRDGAGGVVHNGGMYLIGGWNPNDKESFPLVTNNEVWFSKDGIEWDLVKPNSFLPSPHPISDWAGRHTYGLVSFDGYLWIIGGDANQGYHQQDIWKSKDGRNWQLVLDRVPWAPRVLHLTFAFDGKLYVAGGQSMPKATEEKEKVGEFYYRDIWSSPDGISWTHEKIEGDIWKPRGGIGGSFVFNNKIYIVGGFTYDNFINEKRDVYTDVWMSNDALHWDLLTDTPEWAKMGGLQYHDMAVFDNKLWIIGGYRAGVGDTNEVWFTDNGVDWNQLKCVPFKPTHASTVFSLQDGLVIAAGHHMTRQVWKMEKR